MYIGTDIGLGLRYPLPSFVGGVDLFFLGGNQAIENIFVDTATQVTYWATTTGNLFIYIIPARTFSLFPIDQDYVSNDLCISVFLSNELGYVHRFNPDDFRNAFDSEYFNCTLLGCGSTILNFATG